MPDATRHANPRARHGPASGRSRSPQLVILNPGEEPLGVLLAGEALGPLPTRRIGIPRQVPHLAIPLPATFNTINRWAAGISDTLAVGLLTEAIGKRLPVVALPFINAAQAEHPAFQGSVDRLRAAGVQLLYPSKLLELHEPGTGSQRVGLFPGS